MLGTRQKTRNKPITRSGPQAYCFFSSNVSEIINTVEFHNFRTRNKMVPFTLDHKVESEWSLCLINSNVHNTNTKQRYNLKSLSPLSPSVTISQGVCYMGIKVFINLPV